MLDLRSLTDEQIAGMVAPPTIKGLVTQIRDQSRVYDQLLYQKAKEDLYIFNRHVLGVEGGDNKVKLAPFHKQLCKIVTDNRHKKKLILVPRGHLKSTLITIGYSLFSIVNNPNIKILIRNATWQMAVDFVTEVKNHLTKNEDLIRLYGNLAENPTEWSQDRVTLKRNDTNIKGPTLWATGIESNLVGAHPDLIIDDDLVNRDNVSTTEQQQKVILRYKDTLDLLEPGGQYIVIGTRWSEGDLYSWIMDKDNQVYHNYDIFILRAYEGDLETGSDFVPLWPDKFSRKELLTRLREKGWYEFSSQYLNDPIPDKDATFQTEWFQYYDKEEVRGRTLTKIITVDPAISTDKSADFTAIIVCGIDQFSNIFILDIVRGHFTPNQIINNLFTLSEIYHPDKIGIEMVAYQKALAYSLKDEMQRRGRYLPIFEVQPQERSKDERIRGLQPQYANRKVFHLKEHPLTLYLEGELKAFPRGSKDDLIDSLSYQLDLLYPPKRKTTRYHAKFLY